MEFILTYVSHIGSVLVSSVSGHLAWIQIGLSVVLIVLVLLQQTGASVGSAFGGADSISGFHTRRGLEKMLLWTTLVVALLFALSALLALFA